MEGTEKPEETQRECAKWPEGTPRGTEAGQEKVEAISHSSGERGHIAFVLS